MGRRPSKRSPSGLTNSIATTNPEVGKYSTNKWYENLDCLFKINNQDPNTNK